MDCLLAEMSAKRHSINCVRLVRLFVDGEILELCITDMSAMHVPLIGRIECPFAINEDGVNAKTVDDPVDTSKISTRVLIRFGSPPQPAMDQHLRPNPSRL
jgi:hypothetical protein